MVEEKYECEYCGASGTVLHDESEIRFCPHCGEVIEYYDDDDYNDCDATVSDIY